ncbi:hypothetical protein [Phormidesmis priestleyi]|uniref:hypothetical protein n=1 Tax=Phormidesmis priestleyi TaxID=268141 RepID=UPI000934A1CA|nr:hypothetical protein [Phormidesmis priestleyi]
MESSDQKVSPIEPSSFGLDSEVLIGLVALPVLAGMVGVRALAEGLRELGSLSEEIFRGDRLPILEFNLPTAERSSDTNYTD